MEILQITIEIREGQAETIIVHEDDTPRGLALSFCEKHGLSEEV